MFHFSLGEVYYQSVGGLGASVSGDVTLTQGTVLDIVVGQGGVNYAGGGGRRRRRRRPE
jgi:hypothetical protein